MGAWLLTRDASRWKDHYVVAVDGKTMRGARSNDTAAPHLLAALTSGGIVAGQCQVDAKTSEITALPALIDTLTEALTGRESAPDKDLSGQVGLVVTADALHTQRSTAEHLTTAGHDYVLTVKGNQPRFRAALKHLPWRDIPSHGTTTTTRGRRVRRTITTCDAPAWIEWPGARRVAQLRRTRTTAGHKTTEVVYLITSLDAHHASPADLAHLAQGHWAIENRLHWVRDVIFGEDRHHLRTRRHGHAAQHRHQPPPPRRRQQHRHRNPSRGP